MFQTSTYKNKDLVQSHQASVNTGTLMTRCHFKSYGTWAEPWSLLAFEVGGIPECSSLMGKKEAYTNINEGERGKKGVATFWLPLDPLTREITGDWINVNSRKCFHKVLHGAENNMFHIFHCLWPAMLREVHWGYYVRKPTNCIVRNVCPLAQRELSPTRVLWRGETCQGMERWKERELKSNWNLQMEFPWTPDKMGSEHPAGGSNAQTLILVMWIWSLEMSLK